MVVGCPESGKPGFSARFAIPEPRMPSSAESWYLLVRDPAGGRTAVRLVAGQRLSVGRAPTNHIVVLDERASRQHAEIFPNARGWAVRDLDSRNGSLLDGQPVVGDRQLAPGSLLAIGLTEILCGVGEPPDLTGDTEGAGTQTGAMAADIEAWHAAITHRQSHGRLLEEIRTSAASVPQVGRAAADLCRLAFALGQAGDIVAAARLALDAAIQGTVAGRGVVLLPACADLQPGHAARRRGVKLLSVIAMPAAWPVEDVPAGAVAAVLEGNEAVLAAHDSGSLATLSVPVRSHGTAVGLIHLEVSQRDRPASPDDLEFVLAVADALGLAVDTISTRESLSTRLAGTVDENLRLRQQLAADCRIVGSSTALAGILGQIDRVATTNATVLVRGESGTGKELVARAIHEASPRRGGPFVCLNCAALSETLLESELFGHEKGAFTGATDRKIGKFEAAHGGTLMLDEIGEMSPAIQAKFLRVLEGHAFERVGGSASVQADVRVVAATNRDLEHAVTAGDFRRDLYFRLKVVEISMPPLRHRPEDIPALAGHFLEQFAVETGRRLRGFTPEALAALQAHRWPGNIRELRNCIERAVVLAADDTLDVPDLALSHLTTPGDTGRGTGGGDRFVPRTIAEVERRHVLATLEAVGGNKTKAATILGIERSTLDRKLAKWAHV
jgi:transcriptional regulator with GAF, ATPase, and Fis domain